MFAKTKAVVVAPLILLLGLTGCNPARIESLLASLKENRVLPLLCSRNPSIYSVKFSPDMNGFKNGTDFIKIPEPFVEEANRHLDRLRKSKWVKPKSYQTICVLPGDYPKNASFSIDRILVVKGNFTVDKTPIFLPRGGMLIVLEEIGGNLKIKMLGLDATVLAVKAKRGSFPRKIKRGQTLHILYLTAAGMNNVPKRVVAHHYQKLTPGS